MFPFAVAPLPRLASRPMTRPSLLAAAALLAPAALAQAPAAQPTEAKPPAKVEKAAPAPKELYAVFVTSRGKIGVKLLPEVAPVAVKNFVELAEGKKEWTDPRTGQTSRKSLYDGTLFHRVIPNFVIQGGDPLTKDAPTGATSSQSGRPFGTGDPGYRFADEIQPGTRPFASPCQLAMANSGPDTNGSQFFMTEVPTPHLDPQACSRARSGTCGYVHFGTGVCGCELVGQIARAGNSQTRLERVLLTSQPPTCK